MNFKSIIKKSAIVLTALTISLTSVLCTGSVSIQASSAKEQLESKLKDIEKQQKEIDAAIKETKGDISREKENQQKIDEQIVATEEYIRTLTDLIKEYDLQIAGLEAEIVDRENDITATEALINNERNEIDKNIALYEKRIRAMYLSGNDSVASVLLGADNFFDMLMKIELVKRVADYNNALIDDLIALKESYEDDKLVLENKIKDLEAVIADVETKKQEVADRRDEWDVQLESLNQLYKESKAQIKALNAKKAEYEQNKDELDKEAEKVEEEIQRIIREASRSEYMGDLPKGTFLWPVPGYYKITSGYGSRWGTTHKGIDISGSGIKGAEITAANSGEVIFVTNGCKHNYGKSKSCGCGGGFGNYCIVDHGGGYATLYGHAEKIIVKEGQHVTTGDVLGYVGSTGWSTGWHLHFEVRVDGERKNPEKYNLIKK